MSNTIQASSAILVLVVKYNKNTSNRLNSFKLLHGQFYNTVDLVPEVRMANIRINRLRVRVRHILPACSGKCQIVYLRPRY